MQICVVIAIIAILAAMLLPALGKAREKARNTTCVNNLKQMGTYLVFYIDSFNGYLPPACNSEDVIWTTAMTNAKYLPSNYCHSLTDSNPSIKRQALACPGLGKAARDSGNQNWNYAVNGAIFGYKAANPTLLGSAVTKPSEAMLMSEPANNCGAGYIIFNNAYDGAWGRLDLKYYATANSITIGGRHDAGEYVNVVYGDFHAGSQNTHLPDRNSTEGTAFWKGK